MGNQYQMLDLSSLVLTIPVVVIVLNLLFVSSSHGFCLDILVT
jgi:hypothetical protein